ncbi:MAG TPA: hypothetical protein VMW10_03805 [Alphaproteobacteria bacterium]|nr:hypothetical protein [Alphaproteobacteria bacterium]
MMNERQSLKVKDSVFFFGSVRIFCCYHQVTRSTKPQAATDCCPVWQGASYIAEIPALVSHRAFASKTQTVSQELPHVIPTPGDPSQRKFLNLESTERGIE